MSAEQFPPLADSIFMNDKSKLISTPSWISWFSIIANNLTGSKNSISTVQSSIATIQGDITDLQEAITVITSVKVGTFTRDMSAASGDVVYNGIGFGISALIVLAAFPYSQGRMSIGLTDCTTQGVIYSRSDTSDENSDYHGSDVAKLIQLNDGSNGQYAVYKEKATGQFTLTWTKVGSPTGTGTGIYLAIQ